MEQALPAKFEEPDISAEPTLREDWPRPNVCRSFDDAAEQAGRPLDAQWPS